MPPAITIPELAKLPIADGDEVEGADFVVSGVLGEGGMGRVLLAHQRSLRREVAIKVLKSKKTPASATDALLAEAVITGSLEHPNVVPVHALGLDDTGRPVLVMKRIEGVSLRDLARDPDHPAWATIAPEGDRLDAQLEILVGVCNALHFAHSRGVIHRDVKLENVMIGSFGEVYLVDWGIATRVQPLTAPVPFVAIVGTPAYMPPELAMGDLARMDARTDVYLVGATLHALLTGQPRHVGETIHPVLVSAMQSLPFEYGPDVPAELAAICNRAMSAEPQRRYASALELRRALAAFRRHRGSIALSDEASARLTKLVASRADARGERRLHGLMTECRFGFTQALREWPENAAAQAGLSRCLALMIEHELDQRDLEGARELCAELGEVPPELAARVAALAADVAAAKERESRLARLERERDLSVGGGAQLTVVGALPAFAVGVIIYLLRRGGGELTKRELLGPPIAGFIVLLIALLLARRQLGPGLGRKALTALLLAPGATVVHRLLGVILGEPTVPMAVADLVIGSAVAGAIALVAIPRIGWAILPFALGAVAITAHPDLWLPLFASSVVSGFLLLLVLWRQAARARPSDPGSTRS